MAPRHAPRLAYLVLLCVSAALTPPEPPRRSLAGVWRLRRDVEGDVIDDVIVTLSAAGSSERGRLQSGTFAAIFHGEGTFTQADGLVMSGRFENGEYVCDKCVERWHGRALDHRSLHWKDTCYDRFATAFAPGAGYPNAASLETLDEMTARMLGAHYVKLTEQVGSPMAGSTPVVLSAPMSKQRACNFVYNTTEGMQIRDPRLLQCSMCHFDLRLKSVIVIYILYCQKVSNTSYIPLGQ